MQASSIMRLLYWVLGQYRTQKVRQRGRTYLHTQSRLEEIADAAAHEVEQVVPSSEVRFGGGKVVGEQVWVRLILVSIPPESEPNITNRRL